MIPNRVDWFVSRFPSRPLCHLAQRAQDGAEIPYPYLRDVVQEAGITPDTPFSTR